MHKYTYQTRKRLKIAKEVSSGLEGIAKGVMLGGSMGFGQNYSVNKDSDIDMVVVTDISKIDELKKTPHFQDIPDEVVKLFKDSKINFFLSTKKIKDIEVSTVLYEMRSYIDFCLLKANLRGFMISKPDDTQEQYGFDGNATTFKRNIVSLEGGFSYDRPLFMDQKYMGLYPRTDFLYSYSILYQDSKFFSNLEDQVWGTIIKRLVEEYPNPDLEKVNVLNTHYVYQKSKERLPKKIIDKILKRTEEELKKIR